MDRPVVLDDPTTLVAPASGKLVQALLERVRREEAEAGRKLQSEPPRFPGKLLERALSLALVGHGRGIRAAVSLRPAEGVGNGRTFHYDHSTANKGGVRRGDRKADTGATATGPEANGKSAPGKATAAARRPTKDGKGAAHQAYVERPDAVAREAGEGLGRTTVQDRDREATKTALPGTVPPARRRAAAEGSATPDDEATSLSGKSAAEVQKYVEDIAKGVSGGATSFGTIGETFQERIEFWNALDRHTPEEGGRTQIRLILELPHEASPEARQEIVRRFCQFYEELGVPYWACIHQPTKKNDHRNCHAHVVHSIRKARKMTSPVTGQEEWDFAIAEVYKTKSRNTRLHHPYRQNQPNEFRERSYPKASRVRFAAVVNEVLAHHGCPVRYDPRSYRDMGLAVTPVVSASRAKAGKKGDPLASDAEWTRTFHKRQAELAKVQQEKELRRIEAERQQRLAVCSDVRRPVTASKQLPYGMKLTAASRLTPAFAKEIMGHLYDDLHRQCVGKHLDEATSVVLRHLVEATSPTVVLDGLQAGATQPDMATAEKPDPDARGLLHAAATQMLEDHHRQAHDRAVKVKRRIDDAQRIWRQEATGAHSPLGHISRIGGRPVQSANSLYRRTDHMMKQKSNLLLALKDEPGGAALIAEAVKAQLREFGLEPPAVPAPSREITETRAPDASMQEVSTAPGADGVVCQFMIGPAEELVGTLSDPRADRPDAAVVPRDVQPPVMAPSLATGTPGLVIGSAEEALGTLPDQLIGLSDDAVTLREGQPATTTGLAEGRTTATSVSSRASTPSLSPDTTHGPFQAGVHDAGASIGQPSDRERQPEAADRSAEHRPVESRSRIDGRTLYDAGQDQTSALLARRGQSPSPPPTAPAAVPANPDLADQGRGQHGIGLGASDRSMLSGPSRGIPSRQADPVEPPPSRVRQDARHKVPLFEQCPPAAAEAFTQPQGTAGTKVPRGGTGETSKEAKQEARQAAEETKEKTLAWARTVVVRAPTATDDANRVVWIMPDPADSSGHLHRLTSLVSAHAGVPLETQTLAGGYRAVSLHADDLIRVISKARVERRSNLEGFLTNCWRESAANDKKQRAFAESSRWADRWLEQAPRSVQRPGHVTWAAAREGEESFALRSLLSKLNAHPEFADAPCSVSETWEISVPTARLRTVLMDVRPEEHGRWYSMAKACADASRDNQGYADRLARAEMRHLETADTTPQTATEPARRSNGIAGASIPEPALALATTAPIKKPDDAVLPPDVANVLSAHPGATAWAAQYLDFHMKREPGRRRALRNLWVETMGKEVVRKITDPVAAWHNANEADLSSLRRWVRNAPCLPSSIRQAIEVNVRKEGASVLGTPGHLGDGRNNRGGGGIGE